MTVYITRFTTIAIAETPRNNVKTQTGILVVLCVIGNLSERSKSEVRDLDDPATVQQTVGALQTTVKLQLTFVNIFHSLIYQHKKYIQTYKQLCNC